MVKSKVKERVRSMRNRCLLGGVLQLLLFFCFSCDNGEVAGEDAAATPARQVIVLFSPGGLGDMGYNDLILRGLSRVGEEQGLLMLFRSPVSLEEAGEIFGDWLKMPAMDGMQMLFVLAGSDYEAMAAHCMRGEDVDMEGKKVLLFESRNPDNLPVVSFMLSMYGASFLGGLTAAQLHCPALAMLAFEGEEVIKWAADGFVAGFGEGGGEEVAIEYLAADWHGFVAAEEAYEGMMEWSQRYGFVFPLAGGSNVGVYRYVREFPHGLYTAGMDIDQSTVCSGVIGSVVKRIDRVIEDYITAWVEERELPARALYGLKSGYVDWVVSSDYEEAFKVVVEQNREKALRYEKEYNEKLD